MWILLCIRNKIKDVVFKQTKYYHDFRGLQKVMLQMMPSEPLVGDPVAVVREKSEEEYFRLTIIRKLIKLRKFFTHYIFSAVFIKLKQVLRTLFISFGAHQAIASV